MTAATMATLRLAATVAHALPGVRLRLRDGRRTILEVSGAPCSSPTAMSPCAFRMAVARAHQVAHTRARLASPTLLSGAATEVTLLHAVTPEGLAVERREALKDLLVRAVAEEAVSDLAEAARS